MGTTYPVNEEGKGCGCSVIYAVLFALVVLAVIGVFTEGGDRTKTEPLIEEARRSMVTIHEVENQTMTVDPDEGREAYTVGTGNVVGNFRFIPIIIFDAPGRRELLMVSKSVELPINTPVKVRFLRVSNGLPDDLNYVLELVEPHFD